MGFGEPVALVWLILVLAWTAFFFRMLGSRGVAGIGLMVRCFLLGMLWGPLVLGTARSWIPSQTWFNILDPLLLWIPAGCFLLWNRSYRSLSVADGFLTGFFLGFGYDWIEELFGIVFRSVARTTLLDSLSLMPPTILLPNNGLTEHHFAQHGYWLALPSIVLCAGLRFTSKSIACLLTMVAFVACSLDRAILLGLPGQSLALLELVFCHGLLVPWLALLTLLLLSMAEARSVARGLGRQERVFRIPIEWSFLLATAADLKWSAMANMDEGFRLLRRHDLVRWEQDRHSGDTSLPVLQLAIERRIRELPDPQDASSVVGSLSQWWPMATIAAVAAFLVLVAPFLPDTAQQYVWATVLRTPGYYGSEICFPALILLGFCAWVYLIFPLRLPMGKGTAAPIDPEMGHLLECCMLAIGLLMICVLLLYRSYAGWTELISFSSPILEQWNLDLSTSFTRAQWVSYMAMLMSFSAIPMLRTTHTLRARLPNVFAAELGRNLTWIACFLPWLIVAWIADLTTGFSNPLYQRGFYNGWDRRIGSILVIVVVLLATWATRSLIEFVGNRLRRAAPLEVATRKATAS